ncbi:hypothetical protein FJZ53_07230 [Candidatus Woesearchaeota archaeon]|nr:hypothetical protein [Candidatus Woesearchaeota archaeon]
MNDWLAFFGIWIAEGSACSTRVAISQKPGRKRDMIRQLLNRMPFQFKEAEREFYSHTKQLSDYLESFGKAHEKHMPNMIKNLTKEQIETFLDWYCLGDGIVMKNGYRIFYTSSKRLADDIQELLLKIGRVGIVKKRKRPFKTWTKNHWADSSRAQYEIHEMVKKKDSWIDKRDTKIIDYEGKVYCATVKNHIMYVRRNGKPYWCGNTTMFWSEPNKIFNQTLKKIEPKLAEEGYVGYIDLNCIVNNHGIHPLEFTSRFGYPTISIQQESMLNPIGEFLYDLAKGEKAKLRVKSGFHLGIRIVVPPFPFRDKETFRVKSKDSVIIFKKGLEGTHIEDVKIVNGEWVVTGTSGVVLIVCGTGQTMKQAQAQAYNRIKNIIIPHMYYRTDIGDRWFEDSDKLNTWGYLREV